MPKPNRIKLKLDLGRRIGGVSKSLRNEIGDFLSYHGEELAEVALPVVVVGGVMTFMFFALSSGSDDSEFHREITQDVFAASAETVNGQDFKLEDGNVVILDSHESEYQFDFGTGFVHVDIPGKDDRIFSFSEFPNPGLILRAQNAGLQIAQSFNADLEASLDEDELEWLAEDENRENKTNTFLNEKRTDAETFAANYNQGLYPDLSALMDNFAAQAAHDFVGPPAPDYSDFIGPVAPFFENARPDNPDTVYTDPLPADEQVAQSDLEPQIPDTHSNDTPVRPAPPLPQPGKGG